MPQVLEFSDVVVRRNARDIVDHLDWSVDDDQRWVDPRAQRRGQDDAAAARRHAACTRRRARSTILGEQLGRTDVFELRPRIGFASTAMARRVPPEETVLNVVLTAAYSVLGRWNEDVRGHRRAPRAARARRVAARPPRRPHVRHAVSDGEQKRVQIARAVMTDPELLLLDEPAASLDLGAREELLQPARRLRAGADHARRWSWSPTTSRRSRSASRTCCCCATARVVAAGPLAETLTAENLTETFGAADRADRATTAATPRARTPAPDAHGADSASRARG